MNNEYNRINRMKWRNLYAYNCIASLGDNVLDRLNYVLFDFDEDGSCDNDNKEDDDDSEDNNDNNNYYNNILDLSEMFVFLFISFLNEILYNFYIFTRSMNNKYFIHLLNICFKFSYKFIKIKSIE